MCSQFLHVLQSEQKTESSNMLLVPPAWGNISTLASSQIIGGRKFSFSSQLKELTAKGYSAFLVVKKIGEKTLFFDGFEYCTSKTAQLDDESLLYKFTEENNNTWQFVCKMNALSIAGGGDIFRNYIAANNPRLDSMKRAKAQGELALACTMDNAPHVSEKTPEKTKFWYEVSTKEDKDNIKTRIQLAYIYDNEQDGESIKKAFEEWKTVYEIIDARIVTLMRTSDMQKSEFEKNSKTKKSNQKYKNLQDLSLVKIDNEMIRCKVLNVLPEIDRKNLERAGRGLKRAFTRRIISIGTLSPTNFKIFISAIRDLNILNALNLSQTDDIENEISLFNLILLVLQIADMHRNNCVVEHEVICLTQALQLIESQLTKNLYISKFQIEFISLFVQGYVAQKTNNISSHKIFIDALKLAEENPSLFGLTYERILEMYIQLAVFYEFGVGITIDSEFAKKLYERVIELQSKLIEELPLAQQSVRMIFGDEASVRMSKINKIFKQQQTGKIKKFSETRINSKHRQDKNIENIYKNLEKIRKIFEKIKTIIYDLFKMNHDLPGLVLAYFLVPEDFKYETLFGSEPQPHAFLRSPKSN